jgi:ATPase subunit of ABC transporter with duplicated ATPase domains
LVLDEPTNHLDIQAVEWLEGYLRQWEGSALIVSHDRYFLDQVVDHIWEMSVNGLELYRGNYSAYLKQRQERWALRQQSFETEKERLEKELDYIRRNIAGQNTLQAKGRLKRLSRTLDAIEKGGFQAIENKKWSEISDETGASSQMMTVDEANHRVSSLRNPLGRPPQLSLNLQTRRRSGDLVLRTYGLKVGYADEGHPLFQAPDLVLKRGECAALIGPNGAGKTTFLKTLLGMLPPFEGQVVLGASLDVAYFAQAHEDLQPERTLIEEIESVAPHMLERQIRDLLARFLFTNDEVYRKVATLSGGERGRLALAKLSLTSANLLLLDEPTNHLDIPSQEILQEVLGQYPGTILLVSHDRYLIDALATQIWEVQPGGVGSLVRNAAGMTPAVQPGGVGSLVRNVAGMTPAVQPGGVGPPVRNAAGMTSAVQPDQTGMRVFEGTYSQYQASLAAQITRPSPSRPKPDETHRDLQKRLANRDKRRQQRLAELEGQITHLEKRLAFLTQQLENPPTQPEQVERLGIEYVETQEEINTLVAEWESLQ